MNNLEINKEKAEKSNPHWVGFKYFMTERECENMHDTLHIPNMIFDMRDILSKIEDDYDE